MDIIFIREPIIGILTLLIALLDIAAACLAKKHLKLPSKIVTAIDLVLHAACLTLIMLYGGGYEGCLILVLLSGVITLALSPRPSQNDDSEVKL